MELTPKQFQLDALERLRGFLDDARVYGDPARAFAKWAPQAGANGRGLFPSYRPLSGMPEVPTVCLRLPTGGGKTVLGALAVGVIAESYLERRYPMVLWLVPSDTIRAQTLKALKDPNHPYRRALGAPFGGQVRVFDMTDFADLRPQDLQANVCVTVGTMQTLNVTETNLRKVYAHNENLEGHFGPAALRVPGLELIEAGRVGAGTAKFSFANLLKVQRPIVILDEAHRFATPLAEEVRRRIGPGVVVELTATPDTATANVLYRATAVELKNDDMIKLPVMLREHTSGWQDALCEANKTRQKLAALAATEPGGVRPLLLVQAQNAGQEADWKAVRQHLLDTERLEGREIAVHTGEVRELDGVDLFRQDCPITTIVTVQALKEGWDCSFAYVLCSVANIGAPQDVEQLLGRVLRMPFAQKRGAAELNKAYAHVTSARFGDTALKLRDGLVRLGFDPEEARYEVEEPPGLGLEAPVRTALRVELGSRPDFAPLTAAEREGIAVEATTAGAFALTAKEPVSEAAVERMVGAAPEVGKSELRKRIAEHNAQWSPSEKGVAFGAVPRLVIAVDGEWTLFDKETLAEAWDWSLLEHPADLRLLEFDETTRSYKLDLEGQIFTLTPLPDLSMQLELLPSGLTVERLVGWLDPRLRELSMNQTMLAAWILRAVRDALEKPGLSMEVLDRGKHLLLRKLREQIAGIKAMEAGKAYQERLFGSSMEVVTSEQFSFRYGSEYTPKSRCETVRFRRHYYPFAGEMKASGEEFECALELDALGEVRHWVRNLAGEHRVRTSFWLQTKTDRFYPDFVAELVDGRMFAVEYKGEGYRTNDDSDEKNKLGQLWADRSGGRAVFAMVTKEKGRGIGEQLVQALRVQGRGLS